MGEGIRKYGVSTKRVIRTVAGARRARRDFIDKPTRADRDIYGDKSLAERRALQRQERAWSNEQSPIEKARTYDTMGKEVFANDHGTRHSVSIPWAARQNNTVTHIHPYKNNSLAGSIGITLSSQDVANAVATGEREVRAVASGYTYSMRPQKGKGWGNHSAKAIKTYNSKAMSKWKKYYKDWYTKQESKANKQYLEGKITKAEYSKVSDRITARWNVMVQHKAMQDTAKHYGWVYTRAKTRKK